MEVKLPGFCSWATNDFLELPISSLAEDGTPISSLLLGNMSLVLVIKPVSNALHWTPLPAGGYDAALEMLTASFEQLGNGLYEIGIQMICHGETFVSDTIKGSIDRKAPEVRSTFPQSGASLESSDGISVVFDEPLDCQLSFASISMDNHVAIEVPMSCNGVAVRILLAEIQVCLM